MSNQITTVSIAGIVDKVRAVRNSQDEVLYLEATAHFTTEYTGQYGSDVVIDVPIPLPVDTPVNPGHAVALDIVFVNPFGQRFQPALETSTVTGNGELVDSE